MEACPAERTKRSRLGQIGSCGSKRRNCCHSVYATGASAIGVPGCPEFAACTASMDKVRMVLIVNSSIGCPVRARSMGVSTVMSLPHPAAAVEGEPALLAADEPAVDEQA